VPSAGVVIQHFHNCIEGGSWPDPRLARTTFSTWVEQWKRMTPELRPTTRALYDYLLRSFLLPTFGDLPLGRIDALAVRTWQADQHRAAKVHTTTIAKAYRLLRRILQTAVEVGYLPRNPCTIKGAGNERPIPVRAATVHQVAKLAEVIDQRYRALVLLAAYGGLRWGELIGLRVRHVDLLHGRVTVEDQITEVNGQLLVGPPKTDAGRRTVTLPAVVVQVLAGHLEQHAEPGVDGHVFPAPDGGTLRRSNFNRRIWQPALTKAGLQGLRVHDLRHTAATLAAAAGATTKELMDRIGHSSPAAALRYQHVIEERRSALALALDGFARAGTTEPIAEPSGTRLARARERKRGKQGAG
jgi:integrase